MLVFLCNKLKNTLSPSKKLLFSGFTGSGKTTELIKLYIELKDKYVCLEGKITDNKGTPSMDLTNEKNIFKVKNKLTTNYNNMSGLSGII